MKRYTCFGLAVLFVFVFSLVAFEIARAQAVHDKPMTCSNCHVMHGTTGAAAAQPVGFFLLKDGNTSDRVVGSNDGCIACHDGSYTNAPDVVAAGTDTPGGDFDNLGSGEEYGHDVKATGLLATSSNDAPIADGGVNAVTDFRCASCHDPHMDKDDDPRLLKHGDNMGAAADEDADAPSVAYTAVDETFSTGPVSATIHNAYQSGMSEWCANCHNGMANSYGAGFHHPSGDDAQNEIDDNPRNCASNYGDDYNVDIPFEDADFAAANFSVTGMGPDESSGSTNPAGNASNVMCLSCHMPHASANTYIGRFDLSGPQGTNAGCNFCHKK